MERPNTKYIFYHKDDKNFYLESLEKYTSLDLQLLDNNNITKANKDKYIDIIWNYVLSLDNGIIDINTTYEKCQIYIDIFMVFNTILNFNFIRNYNRLYNYIIDRYKYVLNNPDFYDSSNESKYLEYYLKNVFIGNHPYISSSLNL